VTLSENRFRSRLPWRALSRIYLFQEWIVPPRPTGACFSTSRMLVGDRFAWSFLRLPLSDAAFSGLQRLRAAIALYVLRLHSPRTIGRRSSREFFPSTRILKIDARAMVLSRLEHMSRPVPGQEVSFTTVLNAPPLTLPPLAL